mmetsp:Transcript_7639/g.24303  ORF Transcript_7639/g.24303 Transcript_7639/m.24303 type:complete len:98 (-) Transcript_7639:9-302(-)
MPAGSSEHHTSRDSSAAQRNTQKQSSGHHDQPASKQCRWKVQDPAGKALETRISATSEGCTVRKLRVKAGPAGKARRSEQKQRQCAHDHLHAERTLT